MSDRFSIYVGKTLWDSSPWEKNALELAKEYLNFRLPDKVKHVFIVDRQTGMSTKVERVYKVCGICKSTKRRSPTWRCGACGASCCEHNCGGKRNDGLATCGKCSLEGRSWKR